MTESVMVVSRGCLAPFINDNLQTFIGDGRDEVMGLILENYTFMERERAESDYRYKQIIPYIVVGHNDDFLLLRRTKNQTEGRLHNLYSLGVGGHVNPMTNNAYKDPVSEGLYRELNEELHVDTGYRIEFCGVINDDGVDVGRVHLGLLYLLTPDARDGIRIREVDKMTAEWVRFDRLHDYFDGMETWSQIVYKKFIGQGSG